MQDTITRDPIHTATIFLNEPGIPVIKDDVYQRRTVPVDFPVDAFVTRCSNLALTFSFEASGNLVLKSSNSAAIHAAMQILRELIEEVVEDHEESASSPLDEFTGHERATTKS
jgi:hypothetical protein